MFFLILMNLAVTIDAISNGEAVKKNILFTLY